jgi:hypothetical protein
MIPRTISVVGQNRDDHGGRIPDMSRMFPNPPEAIHQLLLGFGQQVTTTLRSLLEHRHLYQREIVPLEHAWSTATYGPFASPKFPEQIKKSYVGYVMAPWAVIPPPEFRNPIARMEGMPTCVRFELPTVKLFCTNCDRREAFNPKSWAILPSEPSFVVERGRAPVAEDGVTVNGETLQIFALTFECQSCKGAPEVFLIRRQNTTLTLSGRTPIEHLDTPAAIPKPERSFWAGAHLAHHCGQTLAGLFLLRTLIEQHARRILPEQALLGGDLVAAYTATLPTDFNSRFPSFTDLYARLSDALHRADPAAFLFQDAASKIVEHFEAKRLFKIPEPDKPPTTPTSRHAKHA